MSLQINNMDAVDNKDIDKSATDIKPIYKDPYMDPDVPFSKDKGLASDLRNYNLGKATMPGYDPTGEIGKDLEERKSDFLTSSSSKVVEKKPFRINLPSFFGKKEE